MSKDTVQPGVIGSREHLLRRFQEYTLEMWQ